MYEESFTAEDYTNLSPENRALIDAWLKKCGGVPERTKEIRIEGKYVIATEYYTTSDHKLVYDHKKKEVVTNERELYKHGDPPVWHEDAVPPKE